MATFTGATPLLQCRDVRETIRFYTEVLGFTVDTVDDVDAPSWCSLDHGRTHLLFTRANDGTTPHLTGSIYLYCDDVLGWWERIKDRVDVEWEPEVFPYGFHEFGIRDVNGYILNIGQPVDARGT